MIALALTLITVRSLDAPLFLYPNSASLPAGLYVRSFEAVRVGSIVAFPAPAIARRYQEREGTKVPSDYLFIKPLVAGPGDQICNDPVIGLRINGLWTASVFTADSKRRSLPVWYSCRQLGNEEYFAYSDYAPNSFDSRNFGTIFFTRNNWFISSFFFFRSGS
ncbi:MAG: S26 family signal peptidase [Pseudomonadota bacterium]